MNLIKTLPVSFVLLIFALPQLVLGQDEDTESNLRFQVGANYVSLKDRVFSPTVFSGIVPGFQVGFNRRRADEKIWNVTLNVATGNIDYDNTFFPTTFLSANLRFNHLWSIHNSDKTNLFVGGQFRSTLELLDYDGFTSGSWYTAQALEPLLIYEYTLSERHRLQGQFSYPLLSLTSRPSYGGLDEFVVSNSDNIPKILYSRSDFYTINKLVNPQFILQYSYQINRKVLSLCGTYEYLQINSVRTYYKNQFGLQAQLQIYLGT